MGGRKHWVSSFVGFVFLLVLLNQLVEASAISSSCRHIAIGVVTDQSSRMGRQQKIAIEMAFQTFHFSTSFPKLELFNNDSNGNSARAITSALDLIGNKEVSTILGAFTLQEMQLMSEINKNFIDISIISLPIAASLPPHNNNNPLPLPSFIRMAHNITFHIQYTAAIVAHFQWHKVTLIYDNTDDMSFNMEALTLLSNQLGDFNIEIDQISSFSSSYSESMIEEKLKSLVGRERNQVFILVQFSIELAKLLFHKANKMNMMENGFVWIVGDEISSHLDSLDSSTFNDMQGVIGFRTYFDHNKNSFKKFRSKFHRKYVLEYHENEEEEMKNTEPTIFALRAYDAGWAVALAMHKLQANFSNKQLLKEILRSKFEGLSGKIGFKNGVLMEPPTFEIIYVVETGVVKGRTINIDNSNSGGMGRTLRIGIPANNTFREFVKVSYDHINAIYISGFSISVFEAVVKNLPYSLPYQLIPINGSYDGLVKQVYTRGLDAAVGDIGIFADRFKYVDFTEPYMMGGLDPKDGELSGVSEMIWFAVTVIFFAHMDAGKEVKGNLARLVLGTWLFVILVVTSSFTASLTSMMTVSRFAPSVVDVETLRQMNATVGCNYHSFIPRYLNDTLKIPQRHGSLALHLVFGNNRKFCYMLQAFRKGSSLAVDVSTSIVELIERREMPQLETMLLSTFNCSSGSQVDGSTSLGPWPFAGLFIISASVAAGSLLYFCICGPNHDNKDNNAAAGEVHNGNNNAAGQEPMANGNNNAAGQFQPRANRND
uniref:Ionotropic glutamate receptor C-terminal domain-containing protein n=1 Tax=Cucumis sativus TaxID=3659 RepID=A0A0A0LL99_CUCSA